MGSRPWAPHPLVTREEPGAPSASNQLVTLKGGLQKRPVFHVRSWTLIQLPSTPVETQNRETHVMKDEENTGLMLVKAVYSEARGIQQRNVGDRIMAANLSDIQNNCICLHPKIWDAASLLCHCKCMCEAESSTVLIPWMLLVVREHITVY